MLPLLADVGYQSNWLDTLQANFVRNAFLGGTLVAVCAGLIGYFVVIRRDAFAAHALGHIGFPGATLAVLLGVPVTLGLGVFCVGGGLAIGALGKRVSNREIATGTILAYATALGVLFASLASESTTSITSILFGNLLAITLGQLRTYALCTAVLLVLLAVVARPLLFASVDPQVAEAKGVPVRALGVGFMVLLALAVTMAVQVVGTLLLFALVVTPAAAALAMTARPAAVAAIATAIGLVSVWLGLVLSVMFDLPPSFCIVSLSCVTWVLTLVATRARRPAPRAHDGHGHDHHHPEPVRHLA